MSEAVILTGQQRKILREGVIGAYPDPNELRILLAEQMEVQLGVIVSDGVYNTKIFDLIGAFDASGRIEQFIKLIVKDRENSPYLTKVKNEFESILEDAQGQREREEEKARERSRLQEVSERQTREETQPIVAPAPVSSILLSARGIDYSELERPLNQQNWREADELTRKVMLQAANRSSEGWLRVEDIDNFPCEDLRIIDGLWVDNSEGRFGFSVQAEIYRTLGGTRDYNENVWTNFRNEVGWRVDRRWRQNSRLSYDSQPPKGHFPGNWKILSSTHTRLYGWSRDIFSLVETCGL